MQPLSLVGMKQYLPVCQTWGELLRNSVHFISRTSQDEDARAIDHRATSWMFPPMPSPEGSLQICPISNEGERELSLMGRVGSDGLWFVPIDSQPFHLLPDECVRGLCRAPQNTGLTREFSSERKKVGEERWMLKHRSSTLIDSALTSFVLLM